MTARECILDCLIDDDEAYTQIVEFFEFAFVEASNDEINQTLCEMEKHGYIYVNYEWTNEYGEYPYSLTEKGKKAWREFDSNKGQVAAQRQIRVNPDEKL